MKTNTARNTEISNQENGRLNINYAEALRQLKQADDKLQKRKKQIKAQGMKADRGKWHAEELEKKTQQRKQIKNQCMKLQNQFLMMRAKELQKIERLRKQSEQLRQENLKKRSMSRLELLQNKIRLNHDMRQQSMQHTEKMIHLREQQLQRKRDHRLSMYGSRKQSRQSIQQFQASRISLIRSSTSRQRDQLLEKLRSRQQQLLDLDRTHTETSRIKVDKEHSTAENLKSIDSSMRIYNPSSSNKKARKRTLSDHRFLKESTLITQI